MTKSFLIMGVVFVAVTSIGARAQSRPLTVSELFSIADTANVDLSAARAAVETARSGVSEAKSRRLPSIEASLSVSYLGDGTILDRDFSNPMRDPLPHFSNGLTLELYQPLYAGGAISGGIERARNLTEIAQVGLENTRRGVRMSLVSYYLDLARYRNLLDVYSQNISLTRTLLAQMEARRDQGVALKNDITRYELQPSTIRYDSLSTANQIEICNANLTSLLGMDSSVSIVPTSEPSAIAPGVDEWRSAAEASPDLRTLDLRTEGEEIARKITRAEYLPQFGIIAGESLSGPVTFEIPAINKNYNAWFVGLSVKWNISSLFTTNKSVKTHNAQIHQLKEERRAVSEELTRQINEAYILYTQSISHLETERKNRELAEENYRVISNRFDNQLALLTDMLDASTELLNAGVSLVNAGILVNYYYYRLQYLAGTL